jgi:predicted O-methyltransferase YrrM
MTQGLDNDLITRILQRSMPSFQLTSPADVNLGLGYIYYGLARALRPKKAVVVGSKAGFAPLCFARGLADNAGSRIARIECDDVEITGEPGTLDFVDPSYSMFAGDQNHSYGIGHWKSPEVAEDLWAEFGVSDVATHHPITSAEYVAGLPADFEIDLLYIDGDHSYEGVLHDLTAFLPFLGRDSLVLAHDVDPRCHTAKGYEVLEKLTPHTYSAARVPMYPGLAFLLPADQHVRSRGFGPLAVIGGDHSG